MTDIDAFPVAQTRARSEAKPEPLYEGAEEEEHTTAWDEAQKAKTIPLGIIWASKSEGPPHIVTVVNDPRGRRLQCVCTSAAIRGDCWAVAETRRLFGWPEERT